MVMGHSDQLAGAPADSTKDPLRFRRSLKNRIPAGWNAEESEENGWNRKIFGYKSEEIQLEFGERVSAGCNAEPKTTKLTTSNEVFKLPYQY